LSAKAASATMRRVTGTTLCPRCGAPIPWDGFAKTVNCPYCQIVVTPTAGPRGNVPAMVTPAAGAGLGVGCLMAIIALVVLFFAGAGAAFFLFRAAPAPSAPVIAVTAVSPTLTAKPIPPTPAKAAPLRVFGESGNGAGQLTDARSIAVDMDENVYTADYDTLRVQKFDATGKFQWIIEVPKDEFAGNKSIFGLAVDSKNVLWVNRTGALLKYNTADGKSAGQVKGNYDNMWFHRVAIDPVGNIATLHDAAGDSDLLLLDANGKLKKRIKNKSAAGLAMDGAGNVYLSDEWDGTIEVLDSSGNVKSKFGSKKDKHTSHPEFLAVDGKGHIFAETSEGLNVFDQGGSYIKTIDTAGVHSLRSFAISSKNHLFILGGDKVTELDIGTLP
jgi:sugar lactone lactonase YvrE